jgi:hypothetical protein
MNIKKQYPVFKKSLAGVITIIILGSFILIRGRKEKSDFHHIAGKITYLGKVYEELPKRDKGKYRYLSIDTYPKMFEIFIGKGYGDFKPRLERIKELKPGDDIIVYFDVDSKETDFRLNRLIQFIDKDGKPYFIRGTKDKNFGFFLISIGILLGIWILYLNRTGKII